MRDSPTAAASSSAGSRNLAPVPTKPTTAAHSNRRVAKKPGPSAASSTTVSRINAISASSTKTALASPSDLPPPPANSQVVSDFTSMNGPVSNGLTLVDVPVATPTSHSMETGDRPASLKLVEILTVGTDAPQAVTSITAFCHMCGRARGEPLLPFCPACGTKYV